MRTPLLAGNWKLHCLRKDAGELAKAIVDGTQGLAGRDVMIAPTFTALDHVGAIVEGSSVALGGQDVYWKEDGAFTGEVSAAMLADVGCRYAIIGHSERRQYFGETDETVADKTVAALGASLIPVVCVGETLEQRQAGQTMDLIAGQVTGGLTKLGTDFSDALVLAYEPVWAIGTGETATPEQAEEVHAHIRGILGKSFGADFADKTRILYGGSVKPGNVDELMACPNIDGALVGGASLNADDFLRIVHHQAP